MKEALFKSRSRSFFDFVSGYPLGAASIKLIEATSSCASSRSMLAIVNTNPASSWQDRTAAICSKESQWFELQFRVRLPLSELPERVWNDAMPRYALNKSHAQC